MKESSLLPKQLMNVGMVSFVLLFGCSPAEKKINPIIQDITESVYASGIVKSKDQYHVFSTVSGIVEEVFVDEGSTVDLGSPLLLIANEAQKITLENAKLSADFNALKVNRGKVKEAKSFMDLAKNKMENDLSMLERQKRLWAENIGTKVELEQRDLAYQNSKSNYGSAKESVDELERQLRFLSEQAQNNLLISSISNSEYLVKSKIQGKVYQLNVSKGEIVTPQIPIAILGNDQNYVLEMQIDEYDIVAIRLGMPVHVVLSSYRDSVFNALVSKINPIMNVQSKTFTVEAEFVHSPKVLYPNISFEANVLVSTKKAALLIPRNYLLNDSIVTKPSGEQITVKTGLKDYQMVEILSGINADTEIILPE